MTHMQVVRAQHDDDPSPRAPFPVSYIPPDPRHREGFAPSGPSLVIDAGPAGFAVIQGSSHASLLAVVDQLGYELTPAARHDLAVLAEDEHARGEHRTGPRTGCPTCEAVQALLSGLDLTEHLPDDGPPRLRLVTGGAS